MILADTSIWVDHFRKGDAHFAAKLQAGQVVCHPMIIAELALGSLKDRTMVLRLLDQLPTLTEARLPEVRHLIAQRSLFSRGIGLVDVCLIAACLLTPSTAFWTKDKRLHQVASDLAIPTRAET